MWIFSSKTPEKNAQSEEFLKLEAKAALQGTPNGEPRERHEPLPSRQLGNTTSAISQVGFGCMRLTDSWRNIDLRSIDVIHAALDGGIRFFDTARWYSWGDGQAGQNEKLLARALKERPNDRSRVVVSTKAGMRRIPSRKDVDRMVVDGAPEFLRESVEGSLRDLEVECLSLVHLQEPDPEVPLEDSLGELARLRNEGKIQHIGLCNMTLEQLELACTVTRIASVQYRCNPWWREIWRLGILEYCEANDITLIAHTPLRGKAAVNQVRANGIFQLVAERHGVSPFQVILAWLLTRSPRLIALPGATRAAHATQNALASNLRLTEEDLAEIKLGFPV